jgi:hypothetical protein
MQSYVAGVTKAGRWRGDMTNEVIRFSVDASISIVWDTVADEALRCPTQDDVDTLPVGEDLTVEEIETLDE